VKQGLCRRVIVDRHVIFFSCGDNEALSQTPPQPRLAWSPSPAFAGADERNRSRGADARDWDGRRCQTATHSRGTPSRPSYANPVT
jgi:hypothetical protein